VSNIITDAELVNKFAQKAMEEPTQVVKTRAPSESEVKLPGGFLESNGEVINTAEVRELTGADEEAIAKAGTTGKALNTLLQRGVTKLGSREVKKEELDLLLSGDRDALLLGIRKVTFGSTIEVFSKCQTCNDEAKVTVDLNEDVPIKSLGDEPRMWDVETKKGTVRVTLPNGITQRKLMENTDKTSAELNTLLLAGCVLSINDTPSMGAASALSLGMVDRTNIIQEIVDRNPGPRLGEVTKVCKACGEDISLPLSLLDLFRL
jgi:hypothetical protein